MPARVLPVRVGDVELLVETVPVAGSEPTSRTGAAIDGAVDAFAKVQEAVLELASSTATTIAEAARRGAHPDRLELELGIGISAKGNVVLVGASAEATLKIRMVYDAKSGP